MNSRTKKGLVIFSVLLNVICLLAAIYFVDKRGGKDYILKKIQPATAQNKGNPNDITPYFSQRKTLFDILPKAKGGIVFVGDSITNGCEWAELLEDPTIKNRGIGWDSTEGLLGRIHEIIDLHPDKIFIMIGTNDLGVYGKRVPEIVATYSKIIATIKAESPNTKIYVESILPINSKLYKNAKNTDIIELNNELKKLAADSNTEYIDLYTAFCSKEGELDLKYTNDGIHLMGEGYLLWRSQIVGFVKG